MSYVDVLSHNVATVSRTRQELSLRWKVLMLKVLRLREPHFLFTPDMEVLEPTSGCQVEDEGWSLGLCLPTFRAGLSR